MKSYDNPTMIRPTTELEASRRTLRTCTPDAQPPWQRVTDFRNSPGLVHPFGGDPSSVWGNDLNTICALRHAEGHALRSNAGSSALLAVPDDARQHKGLRAQFA